MPRLSVWLVRTSMVHMGSGILFGALILHHKGIPIYDWTWKLLNPHIELMIFGWTMQFVLGMAFWILPRFSGARHHKPAMLGWYGFTLLNLGIILTALGGWFAIGTLSLVGRVSTMAAVGIFALMLWPRIKPLAAAPFRSELNVISQEEHR